MVFPPFFNLSLNLAIRSSCSDPQSAPGLVFADCIFGFFIFGCKEYNQSDFGIDHLVMAMCRDFSCVGRRGCLLWPVHFLGKILLAFALLHSVLQSQICLLLQVFLDFHYFIPVPYNEKDIFFGCYSHFTNEEPEDQIEQTIQHYSNPSLFYNNWCQRS